MNKLIIFFLGFVFAQVCDQGSFLAVSAMQKKCYPLWTEGKQEEYHNCMHNEKQLNMVHEILGFNFVRQFRNTLYRD